MSDQNDDAAQASDDRAQSGQPQYGQYGARQDGQSQYGQPQGQYGQPQGQYGQAAPGQYGQSAPGQYGQPQYGQPNHGQYGQSQAQYGEPQYGQQQAQYGQQAQGQYDQQQGQYGQPQYGQPGYGYLQAAPRWNVLAIIGFVAAFILPPAAIVLGHLARRQIKRTKEQGSGLALAGLILGYVFTAFWIAYFAFIIIALVVFGTSSDYSDYNGALASIGALLA